MEAVVFIGIQATGKSTFFKEQFYNTHIRINLDMLKTRHREDILIEACLRAQQPFVIDNTNVLAKERAHYISMAKAGGFRVVGYYFQSRVQDALQRNRRRIGKAHIPVPGIYAKRKALQYPQYEEGFDRLFYVYIDEQNRFVIEEFSPSHLLLDT